MISAGSLFYWYFILVLFFCKVSKLIDLICAYNVYTVNNLHTYVCTITVDKVTHLYFKIFVTETLIVLNLPLRFFEILAKLT